jgi:cyclic-di-GMP-binding protein
MPSFDIISEVDDQLLDNAINNLRKEILNRFDFRGSKTTIELQKKEKNLHIITEDDMKMRQIEDVLISKLMKQSINPACLDMGKEHYASGNMVKKDIKLKQGIDKETAKKINKHIKESGLKVQSQIMDDIIRVTAKKIDDLQEVISLCKAADFELPLQFENMKS